MNALLSLLEKAALTFLQVFVMTLSVGGALDVSTAQAAIIAGIGAAVTVIANGIPATVPDLPFWLDLALRTIRTYVAAFVAYLLALPALDLSYSTLAAASAAALPAVLAVVKGAVASRLGEPGSAALLPARYDPPPLEPAA